ncbi:Galactoside 2-alpha-L-fucosyltransferase 2 [Bulinus truncatus]|nr:Galactoside 2-alpha-L-fucosyltransferase 2 [Bulinus truncatus]
MFKKIFISVVIFAVMTGLTIYTDNRSRRPLEKIPVSPVSHESVTQPETNQFKTATAFYLTSRLIGRQGNQMFVYATLVGLARAQNRVPFVDDARDLMTMFRISHVKNYIDTKGWHEVGEIEYATFDPRFMTLPPQNVRVSGYLQCWRYFQHAQDEIRREFTFTPPVQKEVDQVLSTYRGRYNNHVIVGVHIRRGDFLVPPFKDYGYGVPNASYFTKAFAKMRSMLPKQNITFLVASEDLVWCQQNLNESGIRFLPKGSAGSHFAILSSCDHVILSGGTFGWWIGWLANGITIYFSNFVIDNTPLHKGFTEADYYPPGWIGLDN